MADPFYVTVSHFCDDPFAAPSKHRLEARDANGRLMGVLGFTRVEDPDDYTLSALSVTVLEVNPAVRRRGVASQLLDAATELFEGTIEPGTFTPDGAAFWAHRTGQTPRATARLDRQRDPAEWLEGAVYDTPPEPKSCAAYKLLR